MTILIGLTGSIGMGKTTASSILRRLGLPICDSDHLVHEMLCRDGLAVPLVEQQFHEVVVNGAVDRVKLSKHVFDDVLALKKLEDIIHPLVKVAQNNFIKTCERRRSFAAVLDVPLLFEVGTDRICDLTIVVSAPGFIQEQRVLARPGMTKQRFQATRCLQMPDIEKQKRADVVIRTGLDKRNTANQLLEVVRSLKT